MPWNSAVLEGQGCRQPLRIPSLPLTAPCRYCGERPQFVVTSKSSRITVRFHSDQSYTDTGFLAEYLSYDSSDREYTSLEGGTWLGGLAHNEPSALYLPSIVLP